MWGGLYPSQRRISPENQTTIKNENTQQNEVNNEKRAVQYILEQTPQWAY